MDLRTGIASIHLVEMWSSGESRFYSVPKTMELPTLRFEKSCQTFQESNRCVIKLDLELLRVIHETKF